jgi:hypothetical protein
VVKGGINTGIANRFGHAMADKYAIGIGTDSFFGYWNGKTVSTTEHRQLIANALAAGKKLIFTESEGKGNIIGCTGETDSPKGYEATVPFGGWTWTMPPAQPTGIAGVPATVEQMYTKMGATTIAVIGVGIVAVAACIGTLVYFFVVKKKKSSREY